MKLNHVNLPVADVSATRDFFEKHTSVSTALLNRRMITS